MSEPKVYDFSSPAPEPKKYDLTACEVCFGKVRGEVGHVCSMTCDLFLYSDLC